MRETGYEIKSDGKYEAVRPSGKERFVRLKSLGADYTEEAIHQRMIALSLEDRLKARNTSKPLPEPKRYQYSNARNKPMSVNGLGLKSVKALGNARDDCLPAASP